MSDTQIPLLIRMPNWVGDAIMSLPALQALSNQGVELHLYGKKWLNDLFRDTGYQLHAIEKPVFAASKTLQKTPIKSLLLLTNSFSTALAGKLAGKKLIGYNTDARSFLLSNGIKKFTQQHEVEYYWRLARFCSHQLVPDRAWIEPIPEKIMLPIQQSPEKTTQPYWVLCANATGKGEDGQPKVWPHWSAFSDYLHSKGIRHVACPGSGEEETCRSLLPHAEIIAGLNLYDYARMMKGAEKVIANDSGPMHIANAVDVPMLGIFGNTDPNRTRPWGGQFIQGDHQTWPSLGVVIERVRI